MITDLGPARIGVNPDKGRFPGEQPEPREACSSETYKVNPTFCFARIRPNPIRIREWPGCDNWRVWYIFQSYGPRSAAGISNGSPLPHEKG